VHAKAWPERAERGSAMCSSFDCPGTTLDTPFRCGADGAGHHQSEDNAMFEGDGMLPVPVYRSYKKMPPVTLRALLPAEGEHETWILLGVCIVLDPYF